MNEFDLTGSLVEGAFARSNLPGTFAEKRAALRRWLDKKLAEAWDEGYEAAIEDERSANGGPNPYREDD